MILRNMILQTPKDRQPVHCRNIESWIEPKNGMACTPKETNF